MTLTQTRRGFLTTTAGAVAAGLVGTPRALAGDGAPEITSVTLAKTPALCTAPQFIAEELLRAEGFTEIRYAETIAPEVPSAVAAGKVDFSMAYASQFVAAIDAGEPVTLLGGIMVG
jgi:NitT/TauT family transport system substrate-binding protein